MIRFESVVLDKELPYREIGVLGTGLGFASTAGAAIIWGMSEFTAIVCAVFIGFWIILCKWKERQQVRERKREYWYYLGSLDLEIVKRDFPDLSAESQAQVSQFLNERHQTLR